MSVLTRLTTVLSSPLGARVVINVEAQPVEVDESVMRRAPLAVRGSSRMGRMPIPRAESQAVARFRPGAVHPEAAGRPQDPARYRR